MISAQSVTWTCVPNGVSKTSPSTLQISLCVTPRVVSSGGDTISGTVFAAWPTIVRQLIASKAFPITFNAANNDGTNVAIPVDYTQPAYLGVDGAALWAAIFPAGTPIATASTAPQGFQLHSYDASAVATAIREAHRHVVASQAATGKIVRTGTDPYSVLLREHAHARRALPRVAQALRSSGPGLARHAIEAAYKAEAGSNGLGFELLRHSLFYDRGGHRAAVRVQAAAPIDAGTSPVDGLPLANDFNTILAHLGGQPLLLKALGLIIDVQVTPPASILKELTTSVIEATISTAMGSWWGSATGVTNVQPITLCDLTTSSFAATLRNPGTSGAGASMVSGMLPLADTTQYSVQFEDTEGTPFKLDVTSAGASASTSSDADAPMPALRTAGLTVTQVARESNVASSLANQDALVTGYLGTNPSAVQLKAEDLVRGYQVDVAVSASAAIPAASAFQSICARNTRAYFPTYVPPGATAAAPASIVLSDFGYVKGVSATSPIGADTELNIHQGLFGWDGWSLAAQRPGAAITATPDASDANLQNEVPNQPLNTPPVGFPNAQLTVRAAAATLPRLRFGSYYSFRARVVDLAGHDLSVPNTVVASTPAQYLRYEPVSSPVLALAAPLTEGEHVEQLVIRSNPYGATPLNAAQYAAAYAAANPAAPPMAPYAASSTRWIAPPKVAWGTAEQHGMFDSFFSQMSAAMSAQPPVPGVGYASAAFLSAKNALYALSQKESGTFSTPAVWNSATGATVTNPVTAIAPSNSGVVPLPTVRGNLPAPGTYTILGTSGPVIIPYLPDPNAAGVCFQQCTVSASGQVTTSGATYIRNWSPRSGCAWPEIGVPQLLLEEGAFSVTGLGTQTGSSGSNPVPITVTLAAGQQVTVQTTSTLASAAIMANNDVGTAAGDIPAYAPGRQITFVHAVQQPAQPGMPAVTLGTRVQGQTNIALTGTIAVNAQTTNQLDLVASWSERVDTELSSEVQVALDGTNERTVHKTGRVQTFTLTPGQTSPLSFGTSPIVNHEFGDTKTRAVSYQAIATSRFREYFPAGLQSNAANFQNASAASVSVRIPATARPVHPSVLYVVPTYLWTTSSSGTATTNTRGGGGLRVYVDRPWYSTGDTEYLGVLVSTSFTTAGADYVSQWGLDPTTFAQSEPVNPFAASQLLGWDASSAAPVPLAEGLGTVQVYAYSPTAFDPTRNLWYFDIEVSQATLEAPFVRLALARYQPNALTGTVDLRLSTVVRADMVKLSTDRSAAYVVGASNAVNVTVTGRVFANQSWATTAGAAAAASGRVLLAQVYESPTASASDADWSLDWAPIGAEIMLTPNAGTGSTLLYFTGSVPAPTGMKAGAKHRLVVTELEILETDGASAYPTPEGQMLNPTGAYVTKGTSQTASRVVFSDTFPLPY